MSAASRNLMSWLLLGAFRSQPTRWIFAGVTVAIGLGLAVAIDTVNRSALGEFGRALDVVNGQASAQLISSAGDFDDRLWDAVESQAASLGIDAASPVLAIKTDRLLVLGLDIFQAARVTPTLMPSVRETSRDDLFANDAIFLSGPALRELGVAIGEIVELKTATRRERFRVAGTVPGASGRAIAVMDLGLAQWRFDRVGRLSRLDLRLSESASVRAMDGKLADMGVALRTVSSDDRDRRMSNLSRAYRVNLTVLALVALFTGAFLVFTAVGLSVIRQQSQLALLSVLGASPAWVASLVIMQGAVVSGIGGAFGCALGLGLAKLLLSLVGGDLGAGYFSAANPALDIDVIALAGFWMLALGIGVAASMAPARAATRGQAADQLRTGAAERMLVPMAKPWPAMLLMVASIALLGVPPIGGLPIAAYASIACLLLAGVVVMPWLIKAVFGVMAKRMQRAMPSTLFAAWRLSQSPASAAGLVAGVVAAISLTVAMAVMVASFRDSVARWLDQILPADVYTSTQGMIDHPGFSAKAMDAVKDIAGIARFEFSRHQPVLMAADRPEVLIMARPLPKDDPARGLPLTGAVAATPTPRVFASEAMADLYGWQLGQSYALPIAGRSSTTVWLAGIYRDYGRQHGSIMMDIGDFEAMTGDARRTALAIWLDAGVRPDQVMGALRRSIPEMQDMKFMSAADIRALSLKIFDRSFVLTYALELAALIVAIFSVATGFAGQALIRQKEFALLAHLGQPKRQRLSLMVKESAMLLALASVWGSLLGVVMSQILIHRVNPQSFHWTMESSFPWPAILALALAVIIIGAVAAALATARSLGDRALKLALQEDW